MQDEKVMIIRNIQNENFFHEQIKKKEINCSNGGSNREKMYFTRAKHGYVGGPWVAQPTWEKV